VSTFFDAGPEMLLWAGSWVELVEGTINCIGLLTLLNYWIIFIVCICFTDLAAGRVTHPAGPRVGYPCSSCATFNVLLAQNAVTVCVLVSGPVIWPSIANELKHKMLLGMAALNCT
jgi:hypothetical protein